jgi:hypothetical protein
LTTNLSVEQESLTKSGRFRSRADFGNVLIAGKCSPASELLGCNADGQVLAALGPSAFDDKTAVLGGHPYQKTMCSLAGSIAGLKGSFHIDTPNKILQEMSF